MKRNNPIGWFVFVWVCSIGSDAAINFQHHNYEAVTDLLKNLAKAYPNQTHLYSIGKSVEGKKPILYSLNYLINKIIYSYRKRTMGDGTS